MNAIIGDFEHCRETDSINKVSIAGALSCPSIIWINHHLHLIVSASTPIVARLKWERIFFLTILEERQLQNLGTLLHPVQSPLFPQMDSKIQTHRSNSDGSSNEKRNSNYTVCTSLSYFHFFMPSISNNHHQPFSMIAWFLFFSPKCPEPSSDPVFQSQRFQILLLTHLRASSNLSKEGFRHLPPEAAREKSNSFIIIWASDLFNCYNPLAFIMWSSGLGNQQCCLVLAQVLG